MSGLTMPPMVQQTGPASVPRCIDTLDVENVIGLISRAALIQPSVQEASTH